MEEIIVIRLIDPDSSTFSSIINALQEKRFKISNITAIDHSSLCVGEIEIRPAYRQVIVSGKEIKLNHGEYSMLYCMAMAPGRVFTREQLYAAAWDETYPYGSNTVDNTIFRLRKKLEPDPKHPTYIKTVFRVGYKIEK